MCDIHSFQPSDSSFSILTLFCTSLALIPSHTQVKYFLEPCYWEWCLDQQLQQRLLARNAKPQVLFQTHWFRVGFKTIPWCFICTLKFEIFGAPFCNYFSTRRNSSLERNISSVFLWKSNHTTPLWHPTLAPMTTQTDLPSPSVGVGTSRWKGL